MSDEGAGERTLPPGWVWAKIREVGDVQLGRQRAPQHHDGPHMRPYLRVANVFENRIDTTDVMEMNFTPAEFETYKLESGDILLNEGQSRELVGRPAMFRGEVEGCCFQNTLVRFRASSVIAPEFALYQFRRWMRTGDFTALAKITTNIAHLGAERFASMSIALPPLAEQRRIVAKLDDLLTRSRRAKEALAAVPALLERYRQAVLAAAFRGELTAEWREKHPDAAPAKVWAAPTINLSRPSSWSVARLDQLTEPGTVITYGIVLPGDEIAGGVPYVRQQDIEDGRIDDANLRHTTREIADKHKRSSLQADDVLLCIIRHLRVAIVPTHLNGANITQGTVRIRCDRSVLEPRYLALYLQSTYAQGWMKERYFGMAMPRINVADARAIPVPVPSVAEQREMIARIDSALSQSHTMSERITEADGQLQDLTRAVLSSAFRGELVPQDPSDEPASVMLERLRASTSPRASARPLSMDGEGPSPANDVAEGQKTSKPPLPVGRGGARKRGVRSPK